MTQSDSEDRGQRAHSICHILQCKCWSGPSGQISVILWGEKEERDSKKMIRHVSLTTLGQTGDKMYRDKGWITVQAKKIVTILKHSYLKKYIPF